MASSNFLQFNPGSSNQETDAAYLSDAQRTGGFQSQQLLPSILLNKMFFQLMQFLFAFTQMMMSKGYTMQDADAGALQGQLANVLTTADQRSPLTVVAYSPTPVFDFTNTDAIQIVLSGNIAPTFAGLPAGRRVSLILIQDGSGNRTVTYPGTLGTIYSQPDPTPGATSIQETKVLADGSMHPCSPLIVS